MIKEKTKIIPMTFDIVFKSVLNDSKTEGYLVDIISGITKIDKKYIKGNIVFKNTELSKGGKGRRGYFIYPLRKQWPFPQKTSPFG